MRPITLSTSGVVLSALVALVAGGVCYGTAMARRVLARAAHDGPSTHEHLLSAKILRSDAAAASHVPSAPEAPAPRSPMVVLPSGVRVPAATFRALAPAMFGAEGAPGVEWSRHDLYSSARRFFSGRYTIEVPFDIEIWVCQAAWRAALGSSCTPLAVEDARELLTLQRAFRQVAGQAEVAAHILGPCAPPCVDDCLGARALLLRRSGWVDRIAPLLRQRFPAECGEAPSAAVDALALQTLDALAYSQTAAHLLGSVLWLLFASEGRVACGDAKLSFDTVESFVLEALRCYPPSQADLATYLEQPHARDERVLRCLLAAGVRPRAPGDDAGVFRPRPVSEYERLARGVESPGLRKPGGGGAAGGADPPRGAATELTLAVAIEFVRAFVVATGDSVSDDALSTDTDAAIEESPDVKSAAKRADAARKEATRMAAAASRAHSYAASTEAPLREAELALQRAEAAAGRAEAEGAAEVAEARQAQQAAQEGLRTKKKKPKEERDAALAMTAADLEATKRLVADAILEAATRVESARAELRQATHANGAAMAEVSEAAVLEVKARTAQTSNAKALEKVRAAERQRRTEAKEALKAPFEAAAWRASVTDIQHLGGDGLQTAFRLDWHGDLHWEPSERASPTDGQRVAALTNRIQLDARHRREQLLRPEPI